MKSDRDIKKSVWDRYLQKYQDRYLLHHSEIGIWQIRLKQNLGFIEPYSIMKKQLVAVLSFRSSQHKTFFKKKLVETRGFPLIISQEGEDELCIVFDEKNLNDVETLFKIRKKYHLSTKERQKRSQRLVKARSMRQNGG